MEDAGQRQHQPPMTKLPGLTPSHGTTTLIHRSGHCYQLHRPHLALPAQAAPQLRPHKQLRTGTSADTEAPASDAAVDAAAANSAAKLQHKQRQEQVAVLTTSVLLLLHRLESRTAPGATHLLEGAGAQPLALQRAKPARHQSSASTHVSSLYPEILALIFSNLDVRDRGRAAQVCVAWREAAYHRSAWRGVEARLHLRKHSSPVFQCLERRGIKRVQVLSLTMRRGLGDVFRGIPKLQSLNLSGCYNMSDAGLNSALGQSFPSLTELNLSLCKNITDASLGKIAQCLKNLESLELGGCGNISNAGMHVIAWGLKNLRRLDLRSCWNVSDQGMAYLAGLNSEAGGNLALEHLSLQDCQRVSDEGLRHIAQGLATSLKSINLSFCVPITDSGMKHIAKIASLRELDLRSCDNISEIGIAYLAEGGSRISALDVSFCDKIGDQALQHISQGLFNLKSLGLSACPISDEGICKIAKTQQDLETLHIGQCNRLTDKSVFTIVESMPHLKCIDLYGCTRISKFGLEKIEVKLPPISLNRDLRQERR
ncbi:PREDICTED: F-box/LRR-repeat protein 14-like [Ceratosolen solmsi marchali]|uniref:F-box/LRR-repeat protein 14-like n=1 Tax=Ceratosolen solmsi marchali TaxID=326594 RepID=A0AAJ6YXL1_9HYME|nr:PREDICTED: F-box/LRR-repeat protein 14-like [Ceratosolen solmsi marchali]